MKIQTDTRYMALAMKLAQRARAAGDVPIGCVIVYDGFQRTGRAAELAQARGIAPGTVLGRGYNRRNASGNALHHAEILAINRACRKMGDWRLEDCTMYVTLEPCPMCAGAILQARIPRVEMACMNPKAGSCGSVLDLLHHEGYNHQVETGCGLCGEESSALLKLFFKELRTRLGRHGGLTE